MNSVVPVVRRLLEREIHVGARLVGQRGAADVADDADDLGVLVAELDCRPTALSPGKKRSWIASLMMTTGGAAGPSLALNSRPARSGMRSALK